MLMSGGHFGKGAIREIPVVQGFILSKYTLNSLSPRINSVINGMSWNAFDCGKFDSNLKLPVLTSNMV